MLFKRRVLYRNRSGYWIQDEASARQFRERRAWSLSRPTRSSRRSARESWMPAVDSTGIDSSECSDRSSPDDSRKLQSGQPERSLAARSSAPRRARSSQKFDSTLRTALSRTRRQRGTPPMASAKENADSL